MREAQEIFWFLCISTHFLLTSARSLGKIEECIYWLVSHSDDFTLGPDSIAYDDIELQNSGIGDIGLILDTSIFAMEDDIYQQQVASALALQLDIW